MGGVENGRETNQLSSHPERAAALAAALAAWEAAHPAAEPSLREALTAIEIEQLKAMGYLE